MKANELFGGGSYLKADDFEATGPVKLKIRSVRHEKFADDERPKAILSFEGTDKELPLNKTNWKAISQISGHQDDDLWAGTILELYRTMVEYRGDMVPGVRVRPVGGWDNFVSEKAEKKSKPAPAPAPKPDDLPF